MASSVAADFGRLSASRKVLVFLVPGLLLFGLYYRFAYSSLQEEVEAARNAYEGSKRKHSANLDAIKRYDELRPVMDKLREQLARNQAALPTEAEVPAFFETLERKVKESGIEITKWTKRPEEAIDSFVKVPVEIEVTGTFMQLKRFFASLVQRNVAPGESEERERERIVSIESLVISQPQVRNREIFLAAKFIAVTFRQDEKGPAAGKPGSPAPASTAPAPLRPGNAAGAPDAGAGAGAGSAKRDPLQTGTERLRKGM